MSGTWSRLQEVEKWYENDRRRKTLIKACGVGFLLLSTHLKMDFTERVFVGLYGRHIFWVP